MRLIFESKLEIVKSHYIIRIPIAISEKLPSRGMVMIEGDINNIGFKTPLEPDGKGSHWFEFDKTLIKDLNMSVGDSMSLSIEALDNWNVPKMPDDFIKAIHENNLSSQWNSITSKAQWDWLRFIRSTKNLSTRQRRIEVACSKLKKGDTRPCCFDRTRCTVMDIAKSGVLLD